MRLEARTSNQSEIDRIFEILQRTNQMNATMKRLSLSQVKDYYLEDNKSAHIIKLGDKYGDYGIIGTALSSISKDTMIVDELALSCRAMGRRVEDALLEELIGFANERNLNIIEIVVTKTSRNQQIFETLRRVGFIDIERTDNSSSLMQLKVNSRKGREFAKWFKIDLNIQSQID